MQVLASKERELKSSGEDFEVLIKRLRNERTFFKIAENVFEWKEHPHIPVSTSFQGVLKSVDSKWDVRLIFPHGKLNYES